MKPIVIKIESRDAQREIESVENKVSSLEKGFNVTKDALGMFGTALLAVSNTGLKTINGALGLMSDSLRLLDTTLSMGAHGVTIFGAGVKSAAGAAKGLFGGISTLSSGIDTFNNSLEPLLGKMGLMQGSFLLASSKVGALGKVLDSVAGKFAPFLRDFGALASGILVIKEGFALAKTKIIEFGESESKAAIATKKMGISVLSVISHLTLLKAGLNGLSGKLQITGGTFTAGAAKMMAMKAASTGLKSSFFGLSGVVLKMAGGFAGLVGKFLPILNIALAVTPVLRLMWGGFKQGVKTIMALINPLNLLKAGFWLASKAISAVTSVFKFITGSIKGFISFVSDLTISIQGLVSLFRVFAEVGKSIANVFINAGKTAANFNAKMKQIQAVTLGSKESLKQLSEAALQVGRDTPLAASAAADALLNLSKAGLNAEESIAALSPAVNASVASGADLARVSETLINVTNAMGLSFKDSTKTLDILLATTTKTSQSMEGLGVGLSYVAPTLNALNQDLADGAAALGLLADAGFEGSRAGTGLNQVLLKLQNPTKAIITKFGEFGISMSEVNPLTHKFVDILALMEEKGMTSADVISAFGVRAGPQLGALLSTGSEALRELGNELKSSAGTGAKMFAIQMDSLNQYMISLQGSIESLNITMGQAFMEGMKILVKWLIAGTNSVIEFVKQFKVVETLRDLFTGVITGIIDSLKLLGIEFNPVIKGFKEALLNAHEFSKALGGQVHDAIVEFAKSEIVSVFMGKIKGAFETFLSYVPQILTGGNKLKNFATTLSNFFMSVYKIGASMGNFALSIIGGLAKILKGFVDFKNGTMTLDISGGIKKVFGMILDYLNNGFSKDLDKALDLIDLGLLKFFTALYPHAKKALYKKDWSGLFDKASDDLLKGLAKLEPKIVSTLTLIMQRLGPILLAVYRNITSGLLSKAQNILMEMLKKTLSALPGGGMASAIIDKMAPATSTESKIAKDLMEKINPINMAKKAAWTGVKSVGGSAVDYMASWAQYSPMGMASPSSPSKPSNTDITLREDYSPVHNVRGSSDSGVTIKAIGNDSNSSISMYEQALANRSKGYSQVSQEMSQYEGWGQKVGEAYSTGVGEGMTSTNGGWGNTLDKMGVEYSDNLEGNSPPKKGPLSRIDKWGLNVGKAWVDGFSGSIAAFGSDGKDVLGGLVSRLSSSAPEIGKPDFPAVKIPTTTYNETNKNSTTNHGNTTNVNININITGDNLKNASEARENGKVLAETLTKELRLKGVLMGGAI